MFASTVVIDTITRRYPPSALPSGGDTTLNGQSYGNGLYVTSSSTGNPSNVFNYNTSDESWGSQPVYDNQYGLYKGFSRLSNFYGEWIKIELPITFYFDYVKISRYSDVNDAAKSPKNYRVVGSIDGINWTSIFVGESDLQTNQSYTSPTVSSSTGFNHIGIVFINVFGNVSSVLPDTNIECMINEIELYGREKISSTTERIL